MESNKFVAYYRLSTAKQSASGFVLEAQQEAVRTYLNGRRGQIVFQVIEIESGKRSDRTALANALVLCRVHGATLIIAKMGRLARDVNFLSILMESGAEFTAVDVPQANRFDIHVLAAVAEHKAAMISFRIKAALAAAKARGTRLGNPNSRIGSRAAEGTLASIAVRKAKAAKRSADLLPMVREIQASGADSLRQVAANLNTRRIPAARGGEWTAMQVKRVLAGRNEYHVDNRGSCWEVVTGRGRALEPSDAAKSVDQASWSLLSQTSSAGS